MTSLEEINRIDLPMECIIPKEESRKFSGGHNTNPEYGEHNLGKNPRTFETIGKFIGFLKDRIHFPKYGIPY